MTALQNKLRARRGETLAEVLIALLVLGLSTVMLAGMLNTAGQLSADAQKRDEAFVQALNEMEERSPTEIRTETGKKVTIEENGMTKCTIDVTVYTNGRMTAYILPDEGGEGG